ncbi:Rpn family recombination-promoting nuclease/putative transposase [Oceanobacillus saliphilus]|uniref:Rpn family recombination-promoting nuclease/putative transposase n=1 Tax=Oceanobacillus saliphilus TaxID=2925834 RepID=UPI00201E0444|nr:Rpn family recombination-promoting nuclease/putative transposase [Oceanobacillus saliphilus]
MLLTTIVKDDSTKYTYTKHDQLFKELINNFFAEFLEAFFPEVHRNVDFTAINPVSEEVYTDVLKGTARRLDIVIETKLKGEDTIIITHVEPQSYFEKKFHERMYHYFSLLYNKYRKPILPIAVFSYDEKRNEQDKFTMQFPFFHVLTFNFLILELRKKNWRTYMKSNNPAAAALLSKMGYSKEEKVEVKKEFLKMVVRMKLNPAESRFISGFFDTYLILNEKEEEQLMEEIQQMDNAEEIFELSNSWERRGREAGREEGRQEGRSMGKKEERRNIALELLKEGLATELIAKVTHMTREEVEELQKDL